jgi:hypothetical protein
MPYATGYGVVKKGCFTSQVLNLNLKIDYKNIKQSILLDNKNDNFSLQGVIKCLNQGA